MSCCVGSVEVGSESMEVYGSRIRVWIWLYNIRFYKLFAKFCIIRKNSQSYVLFLLIKNSYWPLKFTYFRLQVKKTRMLGRMLGLLLYGPVCKMCSEFHRWDDLWFWGRRIAIKINEKLEKERLAGKLKPSSQSIMSSKTIK